MPKLKSRLAFLDSYRLLAIVMVIGIHSFAYVDLAPATESVLRFLVQAIAVQVFFLVDGFLFAGKQVHQTHIHFWPYIGKSARRLLLPWLIFSLIYAAFRYTVEAAGWVDDRLIYGLPATRSLGHLYASIIAPQLYFLPSLFLIRCLAPLTRRLVMWPIQVPALCLAVYCAAYWNMDLRPYFMEGQDPVLHAFWGLQYYLFGILVWRLRHRLFEHAWPVVLISLTLVLSARFLLGYFSFPVELLTRAAAFISQYGYLLGTFCLFAKVASRPTFLSRAGKYTMGIYLLHAPVVLKISALAASAAVGSRLPGYIGTVAVCFLLSLGLTWLLRSVALGRLLLGEEAAKPSAVHP